jgi:hypothetical protein
MRIAPVAGAIVSTKSSVTAAARRIAVGAIGTIVMWRNEDAEAIMEGRWMGKVRTVYISPEKRVTFVQCPAVGADSRIAATRGRYAFRPGLTDNRLTVRDRFAAEQW